MCGIFGAVGPIGSGSPLAESDIVRLRDSMASRGPDGAGHLSRGHVVLAHRRLSIRDHAAPNQPSDLLRCVASRLMPHKLAYRPKASFPTPIAWWLAHDWKTWARRTLRESPFAAFLLRPEARDAIAADPGQLGMRLWPLLNVVLWGDRQFA